MAFRLLMAAILAVILFAGYSVWSIGHIYSSLRQAPQGQALGATPENAAITMVEFMDYRCPACRAVNPAVEEALAANPDVRIVYRHLPVFKEPSIHEARIALAAGRMGKFREMHDLLMAHEAPVADGEIEILAGRVGLDAKVLRTEMMSRDVSRALLGNLDAGKVLRVAATPSFLIGRTIYTFRDTMPTADDFNRLFADARKKQ